MEAERLRVQAQVKSHEKNIFTLYVLFHISVYLIIPIVSFAYNAYLSSIYLYSWNTISLPIQMYISPPFSAINSAPTALHLSLTP